MSFIFQPLVVSCSGISCVVTWMHIMRCIHDDIFHKSYLQRPSYASCFFYSEEHGLWLFVFAFRPPALPSVAANALLLSVLHAMQMYISLILTVHPSGCMVHVHPGRHRSPTPRRCHRAMELRALCRSHRTRNDDCLPGADSRPIEGNLVPSEQRDSSRRPLR